MRGYFVTGTDTGIGKTVTARALLAALGAAGFRVAAMKPVASGCESVDGELRNADALQLRGAATVVQSYAETNPFAYAPAIAPHIAAERAGRPIRVERIVAVFAVLSARADRIVVEGVGGWLAPLNADATVADLARALDLPVVLTVGIRLGCLNHALLSAAAIAASGCTLAGWVASRIRPDEPEADAQVDALRRRLEAPLLGELPYLADPERADLGAFLHLPEAHRRR